jgi:hypothetical protein
MAQIEGTSSQQSEIDGWLCRLDKTADELGGMVERFGNKIDPVLTPPSPENPKDTGGAVAKLISPLAHRLRALNEKIGREIANLDYLRNRTEL